MKSMKLGVIIVLLLLTVPVVIGVQFYNMTNLTPDTEYTISTRTVDIYGNVNQTWVNHTARTAPIIHTVSQVIVSTENQTVKIGKTFNINVTINPNSNNIIAWQNYIEWNSTVLKINSVSKGDFLESGGLPTYFVNGEIRSNSTGWNWEVILSNSTGVVNPGNIMIINVTTIGITKNTTIGVNGIIISDPQLISIPYIVSNGKIIIAPLYDINDDGIINIVDIVQMIPYFMTSNSKYDVNGDGIVNILDLVIVARHFGEVW